MRIWWNAVTGGAFYTRWSAVLSLLVASVFSVPSIGGTGPEDYLRGVVVAGLGWAVLAAALVPVAVAERMLRARAARAVLVLGSLVAVATCRSSVNDAVSVALFGLAPHGMPGARIATNLVTAFALLSIVAVITSRHAAARAAAQRLRDVLDRVEVARARSEQRARDVEAEISRAVTDLREARERMLAGLVDFDAVRAFAERVRAVSHSLDRGLRERAETPVPRRAAPGRPPEPAPPVSHRLVAPPWLSVAPLYALACFPFAVAAGGVGVGLGGLAGGILVDLLAGAATRRWAAPPRGAAAFVAVWLVAGVGMAGVTYAFLPAIGTLGLVPVLAVPLVAVLVSLCRDALARARADERRATTGLADAARDAAAADVRAQAPVRRAVDILHGRAQGACVVFAARVDDREPTAGEVADFRDRTEAAFEALLHPAEPDAATARDALDGLVDAWRSAVAVSCHVEPGAAAMLAALAASDRLVTAVNEALVNAVKHSAARTADVRVDHAPAGGLRVRVTSPGRLAPSRRSGLGTRQPGIRIFSDGDDVVFEITVADAATPRDSRS